MDMQIKPGAEVWVLERDEDGAACDVSGYMVLAEVDDFVIVSPYINGMEHLEGIMAYHVQETAENYDTDLAVFPAEDCFTTKDAAFAARAAQTKNKED